MSIIHLNRIKNLLDKQVLDHIDENEILLDKPKLSQEELETTKYSQAFILYALKHLTGESYLDLKNFLTDGFTDNGIDGVFYSSSKNELIICQSKWIKKGVGGVDKGEILKFLKGIDDLIKLDFSDFNNKLKKHAKLIEETLFTANVQIKIVLAYSGDNLSKENRKLISDNIDDYNDTEEVIFFQEYNLKDAYNYLKDSVDGEPINADIDLFDWGHTNDPYKSYYGTISCGKIAELLEESNRRIYSKNIRSFIGLTGINNEIVKTLINEPEKFFYLNNGIILLCKSIAKSPYNSGKREVGKFQLNDLTIVNGAQTAGAIQFAFKKQSDKVNNAKVFIKIISLEDTPKNFDKNITIASNTQNKIEKRDFVSLDSQQKRITHDFFLAGIKYHTKRDDKDLKRDKENYYFEEATVSLACFQDDVDFSTYAKREIGKLWEDAAYNKLFNDKLNIQVLTNLIDIYRQIETRIKTLDVLQKLVCSHGVYLITHLMLTKIGQKSLLNPGFDITNYLKNELDKDFSRITKALMNSYQINFSNNKYPLSIFKNFNYCRKMRDEVSKNDGREYVGQINLFDSLG